MKIICLSIWNVDPLPLPPLLAKLPDYLLAHLKLLLATANHNFKWVEITHICLIWEEFANFDVWKRYSLLMTDISSANKTSLKRS